MSGSREREMVVWYSRLGLHEWHAGSLVVFWVDWRHHLSTHRVEDGQCGERPGDLPVLWHAPQLLCWLLNGAVVHQLDAGKIKKQDIPKQFGHEQTIHATYTVSSLLQPERKRKCWTVLCYTIKPTKHTVHPEEWVCCVVPGHVIQQKLYIHHIPLYHKSVDFNSHVISFEPS